MGRLATPEHWKDRYRDLVTELEGKERTWSSLETALRQAAVTLGAAAMGQSSELDVRLDAVLAAVRGQAATDELGSRLTALSTAVARSSLAGGRAGAAPTGAEPSGMSPAAAALLTDLFDRLQALAPLRSAVAQLRRGGAAQSSTEWSRALTGLADAVAEVIAALEAQRTELEQFLEQVTSQLAQFEAWTRWQDDAAKSRKTDSIDLEHTVQEHMLGLNRDVEEASELTAIKSQIQTRLDSIATRLKVFRASEERRREEEASRTSELRNEVVKLKKRTEELAKVVDDQETRLMLDVLTQVHSRYAYELRLEEEYQRWARPRAADRLLDLGYRSVQGDQRHVRPRCGRSAAADDRVAAQ